MTGTDPVSESSPRPVGNRAGNRIEHRFEYRNRQFAIHLESDGAVELYLDGCLRKRRERGPNPQYLWTNVELEWEEHHYIEIRFWPDTGVLKGWVNRRPLLERRYPSVPGNA